MEKQVKRKAVEDLGEAAFARMKGYRCVGRKGRTYFFDVPEELSEKFDDLNLEYINSPYHDFDACIMSLKKVVERLLESDMARKTVSDLGAAAFVKMHGFRCVGRKTRNFYFEVAEEDLEKFDSLNLEYINSTYHDFDSAIMSLKKISEYMAD